MADESQPPFRVHADDATYRKMLAEEATMWATSPMILENTEGLVPRRLQQVLNEQLTGRSDLHWFDELTARGPFAHAALLGATCGYFECRWLGGGASETLDVYELSSGVIERTEARLRDAGLLSRVRFIPADLNLDELPTSHYDVVWSASTLHHLIDLEHMCEQVRRALKPAGLFAFFEYVGEKRVQFAELRIRSCERALAEVPARFWRERREVRSPDIDSISPFEAVRSDEIAEVVAKRFETLHWATGGRLAPAILAVDLPAVALEAPELIERFANAEKRSAALGLAGCLGYGIFRRQE
jgi:SAM-dependent methyltransferase